MICLSFRFISYLEEKKVYLDATSFPDARRNQPTLSLAKFIFHYAFVEGQARIRSLRDAAHPVIGIKSEEIRTLPTNNRSRKRT